LARPSESEPITSRLPDQLPAIGIDDHQGLGSGYCFSKNMAELRLIAADEDGPIWIALLTGARGFGKAKIGQFTGGG
jgi:hypothetical protein